jgi:hypothetical protein
MNKNRHYALAVTACFTFLGAALSLQAQTVVNTGSLLTVSGPAPSNLDLSGNFAVALGMGSDTFFRQVGDANFTGFNSAGAGPVTYTNGAYTVSSPSVNAIGGNSNPLNFGSSAEDDRLEYIVGGSRTGQAAWGDTIRMDTTGLTIGNEYKIQLVFHEPFFNGAGNGDTERTFDVRFGQGDVTNPTTLIAVDEMNIIAETGGFANITTTALLWTHTFEATATKFRIDLTTGSVGVPVLNAYTLEAIPEPSVAGLLMAAVTGGLVMMRRKRRAS